MKREWDITQPPPFKEEGPQVLHSRRKRRKGGRGPTSFFPVAFSKREKTSDTKKRSSHRLRSRQRKGKIKPCGLLTENPRNKKKERGKRRNDSQYLLQRPKKKKGHTQREGRTIVGLSREKKSSASIARRRRSRFFLADTTAGGPNLLKKKGCGPSCFTSGKKRKEDFRDPLHKS